MDNSSSGIWLFLLCCILPVFLFGAGIGAIIRGWAPWMRLGRRGRGVS